MEEMLSAGIDIGTSTTQLIFSKLWVENTSGFGMVPKIEIVDKQVIYRSDIYFTPLSSHDCIDGQKVQKIIEKEYKKAGIRPEDLATGAVIITGESSRKQNAREVVEALSSITGDFIVEAAGPDLESVLAGKGCGAMALSAKYGKLVANLDIGGGTTNICFFENGQVIDTACLDIGGRLIKLDERGQITYIAPKVKWLAGKIGVNIQEGEKADKETLSRIVGAMTKLLEKAVWQDTDRDGKENDEIENESDMLQYMKTNRLITCGRVPDVVTFSGGVADCIYNKKKNEFEYGDIGVLLGKCIATSHVFHEKSVALQIPGFQEEEQMETMRATVIGAGNFSMEVSGSTIEYANFTFPAKNIPVIQVETEPIEKLEERIKTKLQLFCRQREYNGVIALAMKGIACPSFLQVEKMAEQIENGMRQKILEGESLVVVLEEDMGKALGKSLKRRQIKGASLLCIDGIQAGDGDYMDVGDPIASGKVIPVVVKTLIFDGKDE